MVFESFCQQLESERRVLLGNLGSGRNAEPVRETRMPVDLRRARAAQPPPGAHCLRPRGRVGAMTRPRARVVHRFDMDSADFVVRILISIPPVTPHSFIYSQLIGHIEHESLFGDSGVWLEI